MEPDRPKGKAKEFRTAVPDDHVGGEVDGGVRAKRSRIPTGNDTDNGHFHRGVRQPAGDPILPADGAA